MRRMINTSLFVALVMLVLANQAMAVTEYYSGFDAGADFNDPRPNSENQASLFSNQASSLGSVKLIDFEEIPVQTYSNPINLYQGADLTISTNASSGIYNDFMEWASPYTGFNTTVDGDTFARIDTNSSQFVQSVFFHFTFDNPIYAWGGYITGIGNTQGIGDVNLSLLISDGIKSNTQVIPTQFPQGGVLYLGVIDQDSPFSSVTLSLSDSSGFINANMGVDDITIGVVLIPSTILLLGSGLIAFVGLRKKCKGHMP